MRFSFKTVYKHMLDRTGQIHLYRQCWHKWLFRNSIALQIVCYDETH